MKEVLKESTVKNFHFQSIVTFPGSYFGNSSKIYKADVWALNPKAMPKYIENTSASNSSEDKHLIAYHL